MGPPHQALPMACRRQDALLVAPRLKLPDVVVLNQSRKPCPSFPCFFGIPFFSPCEDFLVFLTVFPFFSRDFRGSEGIKNPCFFGGFPCLFPKKQGKEGQGKGHHKD